MALRSITVLGGSASTNLGLPQGSESWPKQLQRKFPNAEFAHHVQGGLTYVRAAKMMSEIGNCDLLIIQFSVSIGWPKPILDIWDRVLIKTNAGKNEYWLDQPVKKYSGSVRRKMLKYSLLGFKNLLKYLLFFIGLYKARTSLREIDDQIELVETMAKHKAKALIWIQQSPLESKRILLERMVYRRYFKRSLEKIYKLDNKFVSLLNLQNYTTDSNFYLYDGVHLSEWGHNQVTQKVLEKVGVFEKNL